MKLKEKDEPPLYHLCCNTSRSVCFYAEKINAMKNKLLIFNDITSSWLPQSKGVTSCCLFECFYHQTWTWIFFFTIITCLIFSGMIFCFILCLLFHLSVIYIQKHWSTHCTVFISVPTWSYISKRFEWIKNAAKSF